MEDVCRVGFDAVEEVIVRWVRQFGDGRHIIAAIAEPFPVDAGVSQAVRGR